MDNWLFIESIHTKWHDRLTGLRTRCLINDKLIRNLDRFLSKMIRLNVLHKHRLGYIITYGKWNVDWRCSRDVDPLTLSFDSLSFSLSLCFNLDGLGHSDRSREKLKLLRLSSLFSLSFSKFSSFFSREYKLLMLPRDQIWVSEIGRRFGQKIVFSRLLIKAKKEGSRTPGVGGARMRCVQVPSIESCVLIYSDECPEGWAIFC